MDSRDSPFASRSMCSRAGLTSVSARRRSGARKASSLKPRLRSPSSARSRMRCSCVVSAGRSMNDGQSRCAMRPRSSAAPYPCPYRTVSEARSDASADTFSASPAWNAAGAKASRTGCSQTERNSTVPRCVRSSNLNGRSQATSFASGEKRQLRCSCALESQYSARN